MEKESGRRNHGGRIMEKESRRRNHGGGIMGEILIEGVIREDKWERNHGRGIMRWRHPGGTQQAQAPSRGSQEAPRKHPGGTQEAPRRHPGHPGVSKRSWEDKSDKTIEFYHRKWRERHFAYTRRARPSPSTVNYSKYGRSYARTFPQRLHSPF